MTTEGQTLLDSLESCWLKLILPCVRQCGPAAQTLGGILKVTKGSTFVEIGSIADAAGLSQRTTEYQLSILVRHQWIEKKSTRRRTRTITLADKTQSVIQEYAVLPMWASNLKPWSARLLLAVVMSRVLRLRSITREDEYSDDEEEVLERLGGDFWFGYSLRKLESTTRLSRHSCIEAKRKLSEMGVLDVRDEYDEGHARSLLVPNFELVIRTPKVVAVGIATEQDRALVVIVASVCV